MSKYQNHQNQLNKTTLYLQKKFPDFRFFSRHVGKFYSSRVFHAIKDIHSIEGLKQWLFAMKGKYLISINKPGMSDQYIIAPIEINGKIIPVHIEVETKTGKARLNPDQVKWKKICGLMNVKFIEARNESEAEKEIQEYIDYLQG